MRDDTRLPRFAIAVHAALRQVKPDAGADAVVSPRGGGKESDVDLRLPSAAVMERIDVTGAARIKAVAPKETAARLSGPIPRLDDLRGEGAIVDRHQQ